MSHACGQGSPLPHDVVRAMMTLRANALAVGNSGIRPKTVQLLIDMINADIVPVIPEKGSLGASGDLAPLAHMALVLIGMGEAFYKGERLPGAEALKRAGIKPLVLHARDNLEEEARQQGRPTEALWAEAVGPVPDPGPGLTEAEASAQAP